MDLDLNQLAPVVANRKAPVTFDVQYREKYGKWRFADTVYAKLDLNNHGFNLMLHATGVVVLQLVPEEVAQLMKRRGDATAKGTEFTSSELRTLLNSSGFDGVNDFALIPVGEKGGSHFFAFGAYSGIPFSFTQAQPARVAPGPQVVEEAAPMVEVTTTVETVIEEDDAATTEMVEAVAEEAAVAEVSQDVSKIVSFEDERVEVLPSVDETVAETTTAVVEKAVEEAPAMDLEEIPATPPVVQNPFKF